ncbi:MAG: aldehyde dehydrogenase family protein [Candidatus Brocadiia bacterium]
MTDSDRCSSSPGSGGDIADEVEVARVAQAAWRDAPLKTRLRLIGRARRQMASRVDDLITAVDSSKARRPGETLAAEVLPLAEACRYLKRRAPSILKRRKPARNLLSVLSVGVSVEVLREPLGVVLVIGPSNYPLLLPGVQALQALAAGNAVLIKPGATGAASARVLVDILGQAGLNPALCRVLPESPQAAQQAVEAGVDRVVLTGSARTGRVVLEQLAPHLTPATMELSGCDAVFVLPGADPDLVARAVMFGLRLNNGATCMSPRRVFARADMLDDIRGRLTELVEGGPACRVDPGAADFARELITEAVETGAAMVAGRMENDDWLPVVLGDASPEMRLLQADVFAPVVSLVPVADMTEALRADRQCPYALGASVFGPAGAARDLAERVRAGAVVVNDMIVPTADPRLPFGGRDQSGYGVTRGAEGLLEMTRPKAIAVQHSPWRPHLEAPISESAGVLRAYMKFAHGRSLRERLRGLREMGRVALGQLFTRSGDGAD